MRVQQSPQVRPAPATRSTPAWPTPRAATASATAVPAISSGPERAVPDDALSSLLARCVRERAGIGPAVGKTHVPVLARGKRAAAQSRRKQREAAEAEKKKKAEEQAAAERAAARIQAIANVATAQAAADWPAAAAALRKLARPDILAAIAGFPAPDLVSLDAVVRPLTTAKDKLIHRCISFIQHGPADAVPASVVTVVAQGTGTDNSKVPGGRVDIRVNNDFQVGTSTYHGFSMGYTGSDSAKTRWLQFIWREIVIERPGQDPTRLDEAITTSGGTYRLTIDPDAPSYNTDSNQPTSPFYEAGFVANRTADSTTMFDLPTPAASKITPLFSAGTPPTRVISRSHFVTYLVRGMDVLYRVNTDVEWVFVNATVPTPTITSSGAKQASAIETGQRERLIVQYPDFDYLP